MRVERPEKYWQRQLNHVREPAPEGAPYPHPRREIPVTVRVVWEHDGETWIEGHAYRWNDQCVAVSVFDRRCMGHSVWVAPADVRRR